MTRVVAFKYGLLDPIDWGPDCVEHLFRMNKFWNALVEIERSHRKQYRVLMISQEEIAPLQRRIDALMEKQRALRSDRKRMRLVGQERTSVECIDDRLREIATDVQQFVAQYKVIQQRLQKSLLREPVRALDAARYAAAKAARRPENCGLWWSNYNAVFQSYEVARRQAMKSSAELQFHRFKGEGRFTVQLIHGASTSQITNGTKQVSIDLDAKPVPGRAGRNRPRLTMTIYTYEHRTRRTVTWPLIYDRILPDEARIQQVTVTRRRLGTRWRYSAVFLCRLPDSVRMRSDQAVCGVNLGCRETTEGLLVATVLGSDCAERCVLSDSWMAAMDHVEHIRERRQLALGEIHRLVCNAWSQQPEGMPDEIAERLGKLAHAEKCSPALLATTAILWRNHGWYWPALAQRLEDWRHLDKRLLETESNMHDHLVKARREQYRLFARALVRRFGVIRIGRPDPGETTSLDNVLRERNGILPRAARNRGRANLFTLQQEIARQATKCGTQIEVIQRPVTPAEIPYDALVCNPFSAG
jgi:hypothetical protein